MITILLLIGCSVRTPFSGLVTSHPAGLASNVYLHLRLAAQARTSPQSVDMSCFIACLLGIQLGFVLSENLTSD